jgi:hypothetical protein
VEFRYRLTEADLVGCGLVVIAHDRRRRTRFWTYLGAGAMVLGAWTFWLRSSWDPDPAGLAVEVGISVAIWLGIFPLLLRAANKRAIRRLIREGRFPPLGDGVGVMWTDDTGIRDRTTTGFVGDYPWAVVGRVLRSRTHAVVQLKPAAHLLVPSHVDPVSAEAFLTEVERQVAARTPDGRR